MPHKRRKTRKKRGTRTVGWGRVGQHRGHGQKGGHGKAGRHKHFWSYILRYDPDYFVKKGFFSPSRREVNVVNVGELEDLAARLSVETNLATAEGTTLLDLDRLGYTKLLGMGQLTKPFSIKVTSYSKSAEQKIEEAGGKIVKKQRN